jgi:hypothetical protein
MKTLFLTWLIIGGAIVLFLIFTKQSTQPANVPPTGASIRGVDDHAPSPSMEDDSPSSARLSAIAPEPVAPEVETLEELTKNWTVIPPSAFPRRVKLLREATFKSSVGSSKLPAGTAVVALAYDNGILNLAPSESSPVRGMARVGDTDLKTQFGESYATWAAARAEALRNQQAERQRTRLLDQPPSAVPGGVDQSGKPVRNADGTYPVLLESMKSGQVTDITPKKIKIWGTPQLATMEGRPTWVIDVNYDTIVFCGPLEARAQAHVRDGRVIRWVYPGSGEPVP